MGLALDHDPGSVSRKSRSRSVHDSELVQITETITQAFSTDPTWSPLLVAGLGSLQPSNRYWELFVRSAQRYPHTHTASGGKAAAVWFPPGADELTQEEQEHLPAFLSALFGDERKEELLEVFRRFDGARPADDYFYLSLLAVHPRHQGTGIGMRLLSNSLTEIDALGLPSYLESSNSKNDEKYQRLGYQVHGKIELPNNQPITTFWREPSQ